MFAEILLEMLLYQIFQELEIINETCWPLHKVLSSMRLLRRRKSFFVPATALE